MLHHPLNFFSRLRARLILHLLLAVAMACAAGTAPAAGKVLPLHSQATSWVILDSLSGFVINESNSRQKLNPGDLVQLMTLYTALEIIGNDTARMDEPVSITAADSLKVTGARRLYLVSGEPHPMHRLLNGIAVVAAEDAALAVAVHLGGSLEKFVEKMNAVARETGMADSHFVSAVAAQDQWTTAMDLARLAGAFHSRHPEQFKWFTQREFVFSNHAQRNRNLMLWKADDVGGIMTNAACTDIISSWHRAENGNVLQRHIFAVLLGGRNADSATNDMITLLRSGRLDYETVRLFPAMSVIKRVDILTGNRDKLSVGSPEEIWVTVRRQDIAARGTGGFSATFNYLAPAVAPVKTGDTIGTLSVYFENRHVADFPLVALHDVGLGSFLSRFVDSVRLRMKPASPASGAVPAPEAATGQAP